MTIHSTVRNGLRTLVASLFVALIFAIWPFAAQAKNNNTSHVDHHEITITKKVDKSSPMMAKKKGSNSGPTEAVHFNYGGTKPVYTQQKP